VAQQQLADLFDEPHERMVMAMSVAPDGWSCDLKAWFASSAATGQHRHRVG
jgi:hypothetical protein